MGDVISIIDVGSSTVKHYNYSSSLKLIQSKSFHFKDGFDANIGISEGQKSDLFDFIKSIKRANPTVKTYATSIFRKFSPEAMASFKKEFLAKTGVEFNVISQDEENKYLELALVGRFHSTEPAMLLNIGGGSTEIVVVKGGKAIERKNVDIGVGTMNSKFPQMNDSISSVDLQDALAFAQSSLPEMSFRPKIAFYTGGELNYMKLAGYKLDKNALFEDPTHPSTITLKNFSSKNAEVFGKIKLAELEALMPSNPKWMHGARGCSALAQSIFERFGIKTIVPSDSNLIDGVARELEIRAKSI